MARFRRWRQWNGACTACAEKGVGTEVPRGLSVSPIPDGQETVAVMDDAVVLTELCAKEGYPRGGWDDTG